jgi:Outer membrane protein
VPNCELLKKIATRDDDVVSDVATGYFSLLELDSELDIARRTLATREDSLRLIKARQQNGIGSMLDVRQAEELVYQATRTIPDTERLIEQTENQISLLLGSNPLRFRVDVR